MRKDYSASERAQSLPLHCCTEGRDDLLQCKWGRIRDCGVQGKAGMGMYSQFEKERDQGNFDLLPELHSILSGMKVTLSLPMTLYICSKPTSQDNPADVCVPCAILGLYGLVGTFATAALHLGQLGCVTKFAATTVSPGVEAKAVWSSVGS